MDEDIEELTPNQLLVEKRYGAQRWHRPKTDGFIRSCLDLVGITNRGHKLSSEQLVKIATGAGLPFVLSESDGDDRNAR